MGYQIELTSRAEKDLKRLDVTVRKKIVVEVLKLEDNQKPAQFKVLVGFKTAQFRLRIGDYRVLYDVDDANEVVIIFRIGHRREIYR